MTMEQQTDTATRRSWRGYTLAELRELQVKNDARILVQKIAITCQYNDLRDCRMQTRNTLRKILNALSYVDFAVLGYTVSRRLVSIMAKLRRHIRKNNRK